MKLVYLTAKKYPGKTADHNYILNLAKAFNSSLSGQFTFVACDTEEQSLAGLPLRNVRVPHFLKRTFVFFFWIPWFYLFELRKERLVIFSNDQNLLTLLIIWRFILRGRFTIASDWHLLTGTWKDGFIARHSDYSITTSRKLEITICKIAPVANVHTVYGGVSLRDYPRMNDKSALRDSLGLPRHKFLVGYVGLFTTLGMDKGLGMMIEALKETRGKTKDCLMVFVGGKPEEISRYKSVAKEFGVTEQCIFVPIVPNEKVPQYEMAMDTLVIPYPDKPHFREYGFPMKVYEYMASSVPIIYTRLELVEEVIGNCAYGIKPDDPHELAETIEHIRDYPDEAREKSALARNIAENFSWESKAQAIIKIFDILHPMLNIPDAAVPYILFQRTAYLIYQNNKWINKIIIRLPFLSYDRMVRFESRLFGARIKRLFSADMEREYETIKAYLPQAPKAILDIGCGVAGIDVMLNNHYKAIKSSPGIYLLDKTELNDKVYYGIQKKAAYYNSLDIAKNILIDNGVEASRINMQEVSEDPKIFPGTKFDLIISLISWGFHYPVETYLDQVFDILNQGGTLIIDIRKSTGGEELVKNKFGSYKVIYEAQKHRRILAVK